MILQKMVGRCICGCQDDVRTACGSRRVEESSTDYADYAEQEERTRVSHVLTSCLRNLCNLRIITGRNDCDTQSRRQSLQPCAVSLSGWHPEPESNSGTKHPGRAASNQSTPSPQTPGCSTSHRPRHS